MDRGADDKEEKGGGGKFGRSINDQKMSKSRYKNKRGEGRGGDSKALGIYSKATSLRCGWQSRSHENSKDV